MSDNVSLNVWYHFRNACLYRKKKASKSSEKNFTQSKDFRFLSNLILYDRAGNFPSASKPNGIQFGSKTKALLIVRSYQKKSYSLEFEINRRYISLSVYHTNKRYAPNSTFKLIISMLVNWSISTCI